LIIVDEIGFTERIICSTVGSLGSWEGDGMKIVSNIPFLKSYFVIFISYSNTSNEKIDLRSGSYPNEG